MLRILLLFLLTSSGLSTLAQCPDTELFFYSNTGNWAYEMSWSLFDDSFNELATFTGEENFTLDIDTLCLEDGCYVLLAIDTYGDGWNGGYLDIDWDGGFISYEMEDGFAAYYTFELNATPCDWELPGCTNPEAYNFVIGATIDDGSCIVEEDFSFAKDLRSYIYYAPQDIAADAPLVFVIHGYWGSAIGQLFYSGMNELADEHGFAVCYPQGLEDNFGIPHWNAGLNISSVDDLGFLVSLAEYLQETYNHSSTCTYACGMSNGGYMSYHLACHASETFKAIASVTGTMSASDWESCDPLWPVPVLEIHGNADDVVPYEGSPADEGGWFGAPGTPEIIDYWVALNECSDLEEFDFPDIDSDDGSTVHAEKHSNGINGNQVWLYTVDGGGHSWPGGGGNMDISASAEIWDFFNQACIAATDISTQPLPLVDIWPNPSIGGVYLSSKDAIACEVLSVSGQLIDKIKLVPGQTKWISIDSGLYLLRVVDKTGASTTQRIVIG